MLKPQNITIFSRVVNWHVILSSPDLVAPSIERDDVHTIVDITPVKVTNELHIGRMCVICR